jgi:hypothetical protein
VRLHLLLLMKAMHSAVSTAAVAALCCFQCCLLGTGCFANCWMLLLPLR